MEKVNIILSTYNGEKYLEEQLESLFEQTYHNIDIYIRDDGSKDGTKEIIQKYCTKKVNGIKIIYLQDNEGNLGYVRSFLKTIRESADAEYYAFCDQDDYWLPNKIEKAVTGLKEYDQKKCLLYSSAYAVCDENMNIIDKGHEPSRFEELSVGKALSLYDGGWLLGFTCVFNKVLKDKAFDNKQTLMYSHDIWVQAVAVGLGGEFCYDESVTAYFRRHENTTSVAETGISQTKLNAWKYRWEETFGKGNLFERIGMSIDSFKKEFEGVVQKEEDRAFLSRFTGKKGITTRISKVFYPYRLKKKIAVEIAWRVAIVLGKI